MGYFPPTTSFLVVIYLVAHSFRNKRFMFNEMLQQTLQNLLSISMYRKTEIVIFPFHAIFFFPYMNWSMSSKTGTKSKKNT